MREENKMNKSFLKRVTTGPGASKIFYCDSIYYKGYLTEIDKLFNSIAKISHGKCVGTRFSCKTRIRELMYEFRTRRERRRFMYLLGDVRKCLESFHFIEWGKV